MMSVVDGDISLPPRRKRGNRQMRSPPVLKACNVQAASRNRSANNGTAIAQAKEARERQRRQEAARMIHSIWTSGGSDLSGLAVHLLEGRVDSLGVYTMSLEEEEENSIQTQSTSPNEIDRAHASDLSYDDFFAQYMAPNKPIIIDGLSDDWKASSQWVTTDDYGNRVPDLGRLSNLFGEDVAPVHVQARGGFTPARPRKKDMSMSEYALWWYCHHEEEEKVGEGKWETEDEGSSELLYLKDWKFTAVHPTYGAYKWPLYFLDDWLNGAMGNAYKFVYLGPRGTSTRLHADVLRSYSWSTNVCGIKRWYLVPPQYTYLLYDCFGSKLASHLHADVEDGVEMFFPGLVEARKYAIEVVQEAGETIFVPSCWHHTVENLAPTLSINHNWLNGNSVAMSWQKLQTEIDALDQGTTSESPKMVLVNDDQPRPQDTHHEDAGSTHESFLRDSNPSEASDMSQVDDDLVLLWLVLSKKAREVMTTSVANGLYMNDSGDNDALNKYNLSAILPILEGIQRVVSSGNDFGLAGRCECDVELLIRQVNDFLN